MISCGVIGDAFPDNFDAEFKQSLQFHGLPPNVHWRDVSLVLASLDWNPQEGLASLDHLLTKIEEEPCEFAALAHHQVSKMVHLQLRLSFCGVAEVKGPINETCVKILAELLAYKLMILRFESMLDFWTQMSAFHGDTYHRGTLVLVTDIPASERPIFFGPHRLILCYNAKEL